MRAPSASPGPGNRASLSAGDADILSMGIQIEPGSPISVIRVGGRPANVVCGSVLSDDGASLRVRLAAEAPAGHMRHAIAVVGAGSGERFAHVDLAPVGEGEWRVVLNGEWQRRLDQREHPRFPTHLPVRISTASHPEGLDGYLADVSEGGAAFEVPVWDGETPFTCDLDWPGGPFRLEARCVSPQRSWRGVILHSRFLHMGAEQRALVSEVLAAARDTFAHAQHYLAFRIDDPEPSYVERPSRH